MGWDGMSGRWQTAMGKLRPFAEGRSGRAGLEGFASPPTTTTTSQSVTQSVFLLSLSKRLPTAPASAAT